MQASLANEVSSGGSVNISALTMVVTVVASLRQANCICRFRKTLC